MQTTCLSLVTCNFSLGTLTHPGHIDIADPFVILVAIISGLIIFAVGFFYGGLFSNVRHRRLDRQREKAARDEAIEALRSSFPADTPGNIAPQFPAPLLRDFCRPTLHHEHGTASIKRSTDH